MDPLAEEAMPASGCSLPVDIRVHYAACMSQTSRSEGHISLKEGITKQ